MQEKRDIDYPLFFAVLGLVLFGSVMISSVSVYDSYRITRQLVSSGTLEDPNNWRFIIRNIMQLVIGVCAMFVAIKLPYTWWKKHVRTISVVVLFMLLLVLIPGIGIEINGAHGWFNIPGIPFSLQPTEFLKLSLILSVSAFCVKYRGSLGNSLDSLIPLAGLIGIPALLVMMQPDLGALLIAIPVIMGIYFIAGGNVRILILGGGIILVGVLILYVLGSYDSPTDRTQFSYIYDRINSFLQSSREAIENNTMHHQNKQALIAIGSGGFFGLGFGDSIQKYGYLPEPQGDFIFSIIAEELGFLGAFFILLIYGFIIYRGLTIAFFCEDDFGKYSAFGITIWIFWQMSVNIGVNLSIFPNTGVTLPFVSYGGSSLLVMLTAIGLLLAISRHIPSHKKSMRTMLKQYIFRQARK